MRHLSLAVLAGAVLILVAGCSRSTSSSVQPSALAATGTQTVYPASGGSMVMQPEQGGVLSLSGGAEVSIPAGALSQPTLVSLREAGSTASVPLPRTTLGPVYDLSLDGADLSGVMQLKLPLPQGVNPQEYEVAAYRWNGRTWERAGGRLVGDKVALTTKEAGKFGLQGTWRLASANLQLALPPGGLQAGMVSIPFTVTGQYRFSALPALQRGYTPVKLVLKRDSSGGAGQITGDIGLDQTVAETSLWFQPDPNQAKGEIQIQHVFEVEPGSLDVTPGSTSQYYAVLQVEDSAAPTSQLSTGVDYTHVLPIRIVGRDVVRPDLSAQASRPLQWHVHLNGQSWQEIPSKETRLPLDTLLSTGGIGTYTITLETQSEGKWVAASNEVKVELAPPETPTPVSTEAALLTPGADEQPGITTPTPAGPPPPTPTRRPRPELQTPEGTPGESPTPAISATPVITATRTPGSQIFWADSYAVVPGGCTVLHWNVQNITAIYLDDQPVTGVESRRICPDQSTTYVLRTITTTGSQERRVTVTVGNEATGSVDFSADSYQLVQGACTTLRWRAQGVSAVYLDEQGVAGEDTRQVCPTTSTVYTLRVVDTDNVSSSRTLTIEVLTGSGIPLRFWADQYTMSAGACTNLYWSVDGVEAVYVGVTGNEKGVTGVGSQQVCPPGRTSYTMRVTASDGRTDSKQLILQGQDPTLGTDEVIVHGAVRDVVRANDVNSSAAGDQPGWSIIVEGTSVLYSGTTNCCENVLTLQIPQALIEQQAVFGVPIDWPLNPGQLVEFRAICPDNNCRLDSGPPMYLRLRSQ
jgi:hypothetical protein